MDVGAPIVCKAGETFPVLVGRGVGNKGEEGESISLLASAGGGVKGSLATARGQRTTRRKVRWNDRHGSNLVEVLEFQPSDSDEDDFVDTCICTVM